MGREGLTLALAGDVMLGRLMNGHLETRGPEAPWAEVEHLWADADAFLFNLECAICGPLPEWEPEAKVFHFRMDPTHIETLRASGVHAVALANNHTLDHDVAGLLETLDHLDALPLPHAGAGRDLREARAPAILRRGGRVLGLVSAADHERAWAAGLDRPGINLIDPMRIETADRLVEAATAANVAGADVVVASLHWGPNMRRVPPPEFQRYARHLIESGVHVVWGTSAHLTQGIEFHHDGVILYDTGDFVDDYAVDPSARNDLSFLFRVVFGEGERPAVERVDLAPVRIDHGRTRPANRDEARWLVSVERALCAPLGTRIEDGEEGLSVATRLPTAARARHVEA